MGVSKLIINGITRFDLTSDTVAAAYLLTNYSAHGADGNAVFGSISSGTEGTPTASKGTVSNHSVTVTPSVTNTGGYIEGGTRTGSGVTVSASELVSGTKTITESGTSIDVANYAYVDVNIQSGGATITRTQDPAGGTVVTIDTENATTVEPLNVTSNGTYTATSNHAYNPVTVNVSGGSLPKKQVNFIDYDGTILHSYTVQEANALSALPANPSHTGLTAQGWNWTLAEIKAQLTAIPNGDVWVGQMYITQSGNTEIDVSMPEYRLNPILTIAVNGTITVNWGDNTTPDTVTGDSLTTKQAVPHTYANTGDYTIVISVTSGSFTFYGEANYTLLRKNTTANENRVYANCIQNIRLGSGITSIGTYAFGLCCSLSSITIPDSVTSIGNYAFTSCCSLSSITIPDSVTSIDTQAFTGCNSLSSITIPDSVTSIGASAFQDCYSLSSMMIPDSVTSISGSAFKNCYSLSSITIPDSVTSIGNDAFRYCYGIAEYHFLRTTPPTLSNNYVFYNSSSDLAIYVPYSADHSILNAYKTDLKWSTYVAYIQEEREV